VKQTFHAMCYFKLGDLWPLTYILKNPLKAWS